VVPRRSESPSIQKKRAPSPGIPFKEFEWGFNKVLMKDLIRFQWDFKKVSIGGHLASLSMDTEFPGVRVPNVTGSWVGPPYLPQYCFRAGNRVSKPDFGRILIRKASKSALRPAFGGGRGPLGPPKDWRFAARLSKTRIRTSGKASRLSTGGG
jgi:hypothetical protein